MYPNLSYLLHDLFGTARDNAFSVIQMFGLMLGAVFLVAAIILYSELKRKTAQGLIKGEEVTETIGAGAKWSEVLSNGLFGLVFGLKLPGIITDFKSFQDDAAGYIFSTQGSWLFAFIGLLAFGGYSYWQGEKSKLPQPKLVKRMVMPWHRIGDITIIAAIFGLLGARLFSILENLDAFFQDPIGQLTSGSGLTIYGGLILAFAAVYYYVQKHGIRPVHVMDGIVPALFLGYAVGRLGCQLSGDGDWGIINEMAKPGWFIFPDWAWAYDYPHNVLNEGISIDGCIDKYCRKLSPPVFPTPLYEIIASVIIFSILWAIRNKVKFIGVLFFIGALLMGIERFFIEFIRVNPRYDFLGMQLSQAQFISIGLFITGLVGIWYWYKRGERIPTMA